MFVIMGRICQIVLFRPQTITCGYMIFRFFSGLLYCSGEIVKYKETENYFKSSSSHLALWLHVRRSIHYRRWVALRNLPLWYYWVTTDFASTLLYWKLQKFLILLPLRPHITRRLWYFWIFTSIKMCRMTTLRNTLQYRGVNLLD